MATFSILFIYFFYRAYVRCYFDKVSFSLNCIDAQMTLNDEKKRDIYVTTNPTFAL